MLTRRAAHRVVDAEHRRQHRGSMPASRAIAARARTSFGKHDPPNPAPARGTAGRCARPSPCPARRRSRRRRTPSQIVATSLMKLIFVARKAFDAYLIISAERGSVTTTGAPSGAYSAATSAAAAGSVAPKDDAVRVEDVVDRRPFPQELRVRDDRERDPLCGVFGKDLRSPARPSRPAWCSC